MVRSNVECGTLEPNKARRHKNRNKKRNEDLLGTRSRTKMRKRKMVLPKERWKTRRENPGLTISWDTWEKADRSDINLLPSTWRNTYGMIQAIIHYLLIINWFVCLCYLTTPLLRISLPKQKFDKSKKQSWSRCNLKVSTIRVIAWRVKTSGSNGISEGR